MGFDYGEKILILSAFSRSKISRLFVVATKIKNANVLHVRSFL